MNSHHLRTILWLRWRLSRNQWLRSGELNAVLTMIIVAAGFIIGLLGAVGGVLVGIFSIAKVTSLSLLGIWDGIVIAFLFLWIIGLISDIQRSETISIGKMLHLPVALKDVFFINYVASHLTLSLILFFPAMLGLSVGLFLGRSWIMILLIPLVLSFIFTVTAWTYCLRGWLVTLMVNKRRYRAIIAGITFAFIILFQLPNLFGTYFSRHRTPRPVQSIRQIETAPGVRNGTLPPVLLIAHRVVPFLWVGNGAMSLAQGSPWAAVLGSAGGFFIGGLGLRRAYRSTVLFYQCQAICDKTNQKRKKMPVIHSGKELLGWQLPGVSAETSIMASAFFRSLTRAPEAKMAIATNLFIFLIFGVSILIRNSAGISDSYKPFVATGAVVVTFFGMSQLMYNIFGMDRSGFRTFILSPLPRERILLSKNLAHLPIALGIGLGMLLIAKFAGHLTILTTLAGIPQLAAAFLLISMVGNITSVIIPYRIAPGSMKPTKTSSLTGIFIVLSHMLFPMVMLPIFIVPIVGLIVSALGWLPAGLINLMLALVIIIPLVYLYRLSLAPLGNLLQNREKQILEIVTKEVE
jgi:ABC-2 type transport system permease protein